MSLTPALSNLLRWVDRYTLDTLGVTPPIRGDREPVVRALEDPGTLFASRPSRRPSRGDLDGTIAG